MDRSWLPSLRCPGCREGYELDATREAASEVVEGFLVCQGCLEVRFLAGGSAILPRHLGRHLRAQGAVYRRTPLADPRLVRFVLAALGGGQDHVPFEEVTRRYGDLAVEEQARRAPAPEDEALAVLTHAAAGHRPLRRALDLGTGVGRGAFVLSGAGAATLGVDRSAARVRRARNLAVTESGFRLPTPADPRREVQLDLERLARRGVDFAVADADALPLASAAFDLVVDRGGDGLGAWPDAAAVEREARRVLTPGGLLVRLASAGAAARELAREGSWALEVGA